MSKIKCLLGFHKWGNWYRGLQPLTDDPSMTETRKCGHCRKYMFRKVWL